MKTVNLKNVLAAMLIILTGCSKNELLKTKANLSDARNKSAVAGSSPTGDVVGKITVGYQGWFTAPGDGFTTDSWWHYAAHGAPSLTDYQIRAWPDMREFTSVFHSDFPNLGNGQPANLFSSLSDQTVDTHFRWMQENGIDAAALQRFNTTTIEVPERDAVTAKVRIAAEAHNVKFYIMYDLSGWTDMQSEVKDDWTKKMSAYTKSSAYAMQNGKPVVCLWGICMNDSSHPWSAAVCLDVINWFKSQGCYVIGGVNNAWRTKAIGGDGYEPAYQALNMISPWMIGSIGQSSDSDNFYPTNVADEAFCKANGIDYQPCVIPGDVYVLPPYAQRKHGDFMWHQFYNMIRAGAQGIYISMFDEFNEGNQIAKTAEDASMVPVGSAFRALDEDGVHCSSDYYLRLTNDGGKMLKGIIPLTSLRPTEPVIGGGAFHLPPIGSNVKLLGDNGLFVGGENGTGPMYCNVVRADIWETFTVVDAGNGKVALMSMGKYVSSEDGASPLTCNRTGVGLWETFDYITNADGTVSFRGSNGKYITQEDGTNPMICDRTVIGPWEKFTLN